MVALPLALALAALPAGFAVADLTGVRPLGGLVLAALALAAVRASRASALTAGAWLAVVLVAFALSHAVADALGTWGAVFLAAAVAGAAAWPLLLRSSTAPSA